MDFLTEEQVAVLLSEHKGRGQYKVYVNEFIASNMKGANATAKFPGREAQAIAQGLNTVKKNLKLEDSIRVINHEDTVFILRTDLPAEDVVEASEES